MWYQAGVTDCRELHACTRTSLGHSAPKAQKDENRNNSENWSKGRLGRNGGRNRHAPQCLPRDSLLFNLVYHHWLIKWYFSALLCNDTKEWMLSKLRRAYAQPVVTKQLQHLIHFLQVLPHIKNILVCLVPLKEAITLSSFGWTGRPVPWWRKFISRICKWQSWLPCTIKLTAAALAAVTFVTFRLLRTISGNLIFLQMTFKYKPGRKLTDCHLLWKRYVTILEPYVIWYKLALCGKSL